MSEKIKAKSDPEELSGSNYKALIIILGIMLFMIALLIYGLA